MKGYNMKKKDKDTEEPEAEMGEIHDDGTDKEVLMELEKIIQELQCSMDKT